MLSHSQCNLFNQQGNNYLLFFTVCFAVTSVLNSLDTSQMLSRKLLLSISHNNLVHIIYNSTKVHHDCDDSENLIAKRYLMYRMAPCTRVISQTHHDVLDWINQ